ncbi:MAG: hypothetical protein RQM90_05000 [Methanoculleus sp.]
MMRAAGRNSRHAARPGRASEGARDSGHRKEPGRCSAATTGSKEFRLIDGKELFCSTVEMR